MQNLDWNNLGFEYRKTPFRYLAKYKDGEWGNGSLTDDNILHISEASPALHYGQQAFEGLKAYRTKKGDINLFRVQDNAKRMNESAKRLLMPQIPIDMFTDAIKQVVKANADFVPPYESKATLYIRPMLIGVGDIIGLQPAKEYIFSVFCFPVGNYFKNGLKPSNFTVSPFDRAAPNGTGGNKVGGNYAASLLPAKLAKEQNFSDCIYLDPQTHTKIEEVGAANFFAITKDNRFITPKSASILPSITKRSLLKIAKERLGLEVIEGDIFIDELENIKEAGACGTAAIISPIGGIFYKDKIHNFGNETGEITQKLYNELVGIQFGDIEPFDSWITTIRS